MNRGANDSLRNPRICKANVSFRFNERQIDYRVLTNNLLHSASIITLARSVICQRPFDKISYPSGLSAIKIVQPKRLAFA